MLEAERSVMRDWIVENEVVGRTAAGVALGTAGWWIGKRIGIALLGTAISGAWPLALIGVYFGAREVGGPAERIARRLFGRRRTPSIA